MKTKSQNKERNNIDIYNTKAMGDKNDINLFDIFSAKWYNRKMRWSFSFFTVTKFELLGIKLVYESARYTLCTCIYVSCQFSCSFVLLLPSCHAIYILCVLYFFLFLSLLFIRCHCCCCKIPFALDAHHYCHRATDNKMDHLTVDTHSIRTY